VIGRDVSEKKAQEKAIQRTDKLNVVGALAAGIVHEIKNPLTTIQGFIQLMKEQNKEKSYEAYYDLLLEEIKKIDFIIEQFLILSKTDDMNKPKMNNINHLLQELVFFYQNEKNEENLHIDLKINGPLPSLFCQENQLKQAVLNLLENAKEATKEKKTPITLHAWFEPKKNEINIVVHDEGKGISPERLEKIGEPFFTTKEKGIGLGTTIAYKIIEQHKGNIQYESEIGKGTKVHVRLPCN
jgi:signal transduction histidine kinase